MNKATKLGLIAGVSLVLIGGIIFTAAMFMLKWDFKKLSTIKNEINTYEIHENYKNISIITNTADVSFIPTESANTSVICHEESNMKHSVSVENDTLTIKVINTKKWYEYIGISFEQKKISVSIPQGKYSDLAIKSNTGSIKIPKNFSFENIDLQGDTGDITNYSSATNKIKIKTSTGKIINQYNSANSIDLSVSTGDIKVSDLICKGDLNINVSTGKIDLNNIICNNIISTGNTGDITLKNAITNEKLTIKRSTGDIKLDNSDAGEIFIETDTGDVSGTLRSEMVYIVETDTGRVDVPKTITGGKCEIHTDTGDIKIKRIIKNEPNN